ncbi:hypothetical protein CDCA_CDCA07G2257 [Cyanidium caldarium]|uniref:RING-type domain-containing protein n=1 Tax=Cyanidium caldarium TaxID=2771 RepID=A0AAV9IV69_CYACA|nr:hypothetical protein CDCA_CDCA07G2257 [Cyanidium caldarium]|eukprot:ctg_411.g210
MEQETRANGQRRENGDAKGDASDAGQSAGAKTCPFAGKVAKETGCPFLRQQSKPSSQDGAATAATPDAIQSAPPGTSFSSSAQCPFARGRDRPAVPAVRGVQSLLCPLCHTLPAPHSAGYALATPCTHIYCGWCARTSRQRPLRDCLICGCDIDRWVSGPKAVEEVRLFADLETAARQHLTLENARQCVWVGVQRGDRWLLEAALHTYERELPAVGTPVEENARDPEDDASFISRHGVNTRALYGVACGKLAELELSQTNAVEEEEAVERAYRYACRAVDLFAEPFMREHAPDNAQHLRQSLQRVEQATQRWMQQLRMHSSQTAADGDTPAGSG